MVSNVSTRPATGRTLASELTPEQQVELRRQAAQTARQHLINTLRLADRAIQDGQPVLARRHLSTALRAVGGR